MPRSEFSSETALKRYLKPRSFLQTASLANEIVCVLNGAKLKALKRDLKAKAKYLVETAELSRSKTSCAVLAEQCGDLYTALAFAESRHGDRPDKREKYDLRGILDESELEVAIERAKKVMNTRVISPRLIRSAKEKMQANSRLIGRYGHNLYFSGPDIGKRAAKALGGITLDPASSAEANKWIGAKAIYTEADDGLKQDWTGERVFCNPPYNGGLIPAFVKKALSEAEQAILYLNNNTETTTWGQLILKSKEVTALCFPAGRMRFWNAEGPNKTTAIQGSWLIGIRVEAKRFCRAFKGLGACSPWRAF